VKYPGISIVLLLVGFTVSGQVDSLNNGAVKPPDSLYVIRNVERNGVILPEVEIKEVNIIGRRSFTRRSDFSRYNRLVYNIKRVYPYAILVRSKLGEVNGILAGIPDDNNRRKFLRDFEKEIFREYEGDMRKMTITQGRILIKLIDRETLNTSYALIREYRGKFSAAFWQSIARIFGTNLKDEYDPYGDDILIELIVNEIEQGRL
jgi:hypothetical protein